MRARHARTPAAEASNHPSVQLDHPGALLDQTTVAGPERTPGYRRWTANTDGQFDAGARDRPLSHGIRSKDVSPRCPRTPSIANSRHQLQLMNVRPARALHLRPTHENTLVCVARDRLGVAAPCQDIPGMILLGGLASKRQTQVAAADDREPRMLLHKCARS